MNVAGKIYDTDETDRIKDWVQRQQADFSASEKTAGFSNRVIVGSIIVVAVVGILLLSRKIIK